MTKHNEEQQLSKDEQTKVQILLTFANYQWEQARQSEDQRATMTNLIIAIAVALQGFIANSGFDRSSLVLAVIITLLGIYGIVASAKLYERFRLSTNRVGEIMKNLDSLYPDTHLRFLQKTADAEHVDRFPRLHKVRLHKVWYVLHFVIVLIGIVSMMLILTK